MREEITFQFGIDGNQIYCNIIGLECLAEHPFGFGDNKKQALEDLVSQLGSDLN